jgi:Cdc6-like AAA superfamily ATPase
MEKHTSTSISEVDLRAARIAAQRKLRHAKKEDSELEDVVTYYYAATKQGISNANSLEISSGLVRNGYAPILTQASSIDEFLSQIVKEKIPQQIAGVHEFLKTREAEPPVISLGPHVYRRTPLLLKPELLVGLENQYSLIDEQIKKLFLWNPITYTNPFKKNSDKGMILYGPPGTGKSSLLKHAVYYAKKLSKRSGISLHQETFSENDMSKWVGESSKNFQKKFDTISKPSGVGILILEDADLYMHNRDDAHSSGTSHVTNRFMQNTSGFEETPYNNVLVYITTNRMDKLDGAVKRRISKHVEVPAFSSEKQYLQLASYVLDWAESSLHADVARIGYDHSILPSVMKSFCEDISQSRLGTLDELVFDLPVDQRHDAVEQSYKELSLEDIQRIATNYVF